MRFADEGPPLPPDTVLQLKAGLNLAGKAGFMHESSESAQIGFHAGTRSRVIAIPCSNAGAEAQALPARITVGAYPPPPLHR